MKFESFLLEISQYQRQLNKNWYKLLSVALMYIYIQVHKYPENEKKINFPIGYDVPWM